MYNEMILFRVDRKMRNSLIQQARQEKKTVAAYLRDIHQEHCMNKYAIECPHCNCLNMRKKQNCDKCGKEY